MGPWFAVLALQPDDSEAERAIEDLRGAVGNGQQVITSDSEHDTAALVRRAQLLQEAGDFATAEKLLAQAQAAAGGDLGLLVLREELRMRHSEQRLEIAKRRAASDSHSKAWQLVERLENEQKRSEIEILNARAERLPGDALVLCGSSPRLLKSMSGPPSAWKARRTNCLSVRITAPAYWRLPLRNAARRETISVRSLLPIRHIRTLRSG
ncbi:MAG: hypothetical protein JF612_14995 [Planctomycetia bacterium]|nr:hypothetical protein [Planctomycetia bacterium]